MLRGAAAALGEDVGRLLLHLGRPAAATAALGGDDLAPARLGLAERLGRHVDCHERRVAERSVPLAQVAAAAARELDDDGVSMAALGMMRRRQTLSVAQFAGLRRRAQDVRDGVREGPTPLRRRAASQVLGDGRRLDPRGRRRPAPLARGAVDEDRLDEVVQPAQPVHAVDRRLPTGRGVSLRRRLVGGSPELHGVVVRGDAPERGV
mmetsp:Transcript_15739/g.63385  ORF Transcript_15739/g.63385 Transcript_15739/m.63385 type:complete len:207 (+) Transcript_15739:1036-1656(+)